MIKNPEIELTKLNKSESKLYIKTEQSGDVLIRNLKRARKLYKLINQSKSDYPEILIKDNFIELISKFYTYCQEREYTVQEVKKANFHILLVCF